MEKALSDAVLCERLGRNARETVPTPWAEVMDRAEARYKELIEEKEEHRDADE